ncbi:acyltransferase [Methylosinus sp. PW1]|uniref:acyltransferase family protein n=1 Tax=Methylosinus sp. PW1 TaxID=107636 RepID=UPI00056A1FEC|nr:acyltransferase [Methylosinus sp. PW1]
MSKQSGEYFPSIDYLRLACAIGVVLFHLVYSSSRGSLAGLIVAPGLEMPEGVWFRYGWVAVPVFFVISGLVIAESAATASPWSFLRRRAERLFPAVWLCAPISAFIWIAHGRNASETSLLLLKSLALIPGGEWIDAPYWTLGCEIGFYGVVFLFIALADNRRLDRLAIGLAAVSVLFWIVFFLEKRFGMRLGASLFAGLKPLPVYYGAYFALGMLIYFYKRGRRGHWIALAIAACSIAAGLDSSQLLSRPEAASATPLLLFLLGVAVIALARPCASAGHLALARLCGLTTYPLYLLHFALGLETLQFLVRRGMAAFPASLVAAALMILLAALIAARLEPLVRRRLSRAISAVEPVLALHGPARLFSAPPHERDDEFHAERQATSGCRWR